MKKISILIFAAFALAFSGCQDEAESGGTALEEMAGDWWVTFDANYYHYMNCYNEAYGEDKPFPAYSADINGDGVVNLTDLESSEYAEAWTGMKDAPIRIYTYNTAANDKTKMWVEESFWPTKTQVDVDYAAKTFSVTDKDNIIVTKPKNSDPYYCTVNILGGKILKNAAKTPSGNPADSIIFYIKYNDDYGNDIWYKVSGFRRSGFKEDDF
ncbi:MAG: lipid-binding protein [Bacteroidales bacterium]|nr:lipid-binding protein [Bacteroidales bacterium]